MVAVEKTGDVIVTPDGQALIVQLLHLPVQTTAQVMVNVIVMEAVVVTLIIILIVNGEALIVASKDLEAPKSKVSPADMTTELNALKDCIVLRCIFVTLLLTNAYAPTTLQQLHVR